MALVVFKKDPAERVPVFFEFADRLAEGETLSAIASGFPLVIGAPTAPGLEFYLESALVDGKTIPAPTISGTQVVAWVRGGVDGKEYTVRCEVVTSLGKRPVAGGRIQARSVTGCAT